MTIWIVALLTIVFLPLLVYRMLVFNLPLYQFEFQRIQVYEHINKELADQKANEVILFHQQKGSLDETFFTPNEISHIEDVRGVIKIANNLFIVTGAAFLLLILTLMVLRKFGEVASGLTIGSILTLVTVGLGSTLTLFFFDLAFEIFHKIVFKNNYLFSQADSNLINLFPPEFFADLTAYFVLLTILISFVILFFSWLINHTNQRL